MDKSKEEQERIMIAFTRLEDKSSGLARIQNFKVRVSNIVRQSNTSGGRRGGEGRDHPCDRPNSSGEGEGRPKLIQMGEGGKVSNS